MVAVLQPYGREDITWLVCAPDMCQGGGTLVMCEHAMTWAFVTWSLRLRMDVCRPCQVRCPLGVAPLTITGGGGVFPPFEVAGEIYPVVCGL